MLVYIDKQVHECIESFYEYAKQKYITLDEITILNKIQRLYGGLDNLGNYASYYANARLKTDWISKGYKECIIEDFHFAYNIYKNDINLKKKNIFSEIILL